jgi:hypothetical protein
MILCLAHLPAEDVVTLPKGTPWRVPWELLMLGPFQSCVLSDGDAMRHITAAALVRSAVHRSSVPEEPLHADDYSSLLVYPPDTTLVDAARFVVETGWEVAIVGDVDARLLSSRSLFRALLQSAGNELSGPIATSGLARGHASPHHTYCGRR